MTVSVGDLVKARDEDFEKALKWNLRRPEWTAFVEPEVIDRTNEVLAKGIASITAQLTDRGEDAPPEWRKRAKTLLVLFQGRKGEVNRQIKELNRGEADEVASWRTFAAALARALSATNGGQWYLDRIVVPGGDLSAGEWLTLRQARTATEEVA